MKVSESDKRKFDRFAKTMFVCAVSIGMFNIAYAQFFLDISIFENPITNTVLLFVLIGMQIDSKSKGQ